MHSVVLCSQLTSEECAYSDNVLGVIIVRDWLAATLTASAFALIGPAVCYAGIHAQAESVHQNCVLERCAYLNLIVVLHLPSLFFFFFFFVEFGCWVTLDVVIEIRMLGWVLLHSVG